jgi:hypothetical protein
MDLSVRADDEAQPERTSEILARLVQRTDVGNTNVGTLLDGMKDRGFGLIIFLFSLPNAVLPIAWILGTPVLIFSIQLVLGYTEPWLPGSMRRASVSRDTFAKLISFAVRYLQKMETLLQPRWTWLTGRFMERVLGLYMVFLTLVLLVPIVPFGNALPAFGLGIIAVGIMERDGIAIIIGSLIGAPMCF